MSQNSLILPTTGTVSGLTVVQDVNAALDTLNTLASGGSAPASPEDCQWWCDTTNNLLKQWDATNTVWRVIGKLRVPMLGGATFGQIINTTNTTTLTAAQSGSLVYGSGATSYTNTLPSVATTGANAMFTFFNTGTGNMTVARAGTDTISVNNATVTSLVLGPGDSLTLACLGSGGTWFAIDGSVQLQYSATFGQSKANPGFIKLPGGFIMQGGTSVAIASGSTGTTTFTQAFPNACIGFSCIYENTGANAPTLGNPVQLFALSATGFTLANGGSAASQYPYVAFGY